MFKMSQSAVFHLHRIERSISSEANKRFRLTCEQDIKEMLRLAAASRDTSVRKSLAVFIRNCDIDSANEYQFLKSA